MDARLRWFSLYYFAYYAALGAYTPYVGRGVVGEVVQREPAQAGVHAGGGQNSRSGAAQR